MKIKIGIPVFLLLLVLVGCGAKASKEPVAGELLLSETFDSEESWERFSNEDSDLKVSDGVYHIEVNDTGYIWGQNTLKTEDVIIEVETNQLSAFDNNGYGIICRADAENNGDGYYFLISGDGYISIRMGLGDDVPELVEWEENSKINKGQAINKIKAVCVGDYLALYVNDTFAAEATDSTYRSGFTALTSMAGDGGDAHITFDNLTIWKATVE